MRVLTLCSYALLIVDTRNITARHRGGNAWEHGAPKPTAQDKVCWAPAEAAVGIRRSTDPLTSPVRPHGGRETQPPDRRAAARSRVTTYKSSMMMRRNVIAQPLIPVGVFAPVIRIPFVRRLLRELGTEDLVNCVAVVALVAHHMPPKL